MAALAVLGVLRKCAYLEDGTEALLFSPCLSISPAAVCLPPAGAVRILPACLLVAFFPSLAFHNLFFFLSSGKKKKK